MASNDNEYFWNVKDTRELNIKIMVSAVVSLAVVVIIAIVLHMYAIWSLSRQARIAQELGITMPPESEQPKTGLDPSIIASIPTFIFKRDMENTTVECAVCLSRFIEGDISRELPNCKHIFHAECIDIWFGSDSTCPICRADLQQLRLH